MSLRDLLEKTLLRVPSLSLEDIPDPTLLEDPLGVVQRIEVLAQQYSKIPHKCLRYLALDNGEFEASWRSYGKSIRYARALCRPSLVQRVALESSLSLTSPLDAADRMGSMTLYVFQRATDHLLYSSTESAVSFYGCEQERRKIFDYVQRCERLLPLQKGDTSKAQRVIQGIQAHLLAYGRWSESVRSILKKDSGPHLL